MTVTIKPKLSRPCVICTCARDKYGYGKRWYQGKNEKAHRVAYAEHHGLTMADIEGVIIRHKCDVRACIEPTHLEPGTHADNYNDMIKRGRRGDTGHRGEAHPLHKLTAKQVQEIRQRLANGQIGSRLAIEYGVAAPIISQIKHRKIWRHV